MPPNPFSNVLVVPVHLFVPNNCAKTNDEQDPGGFIFSGRFTERQRRRPFLFHLHVGGFRSNDAPFCGIYPRPRPLVQHGETTLVSAMGQTKDAESRKRDEIGT